MDKPRIRFILTENENVPTGGVKQTYRQVDILNGNGFDAAVVLPDEGEAKGWFVQDTRILRMRDFSLQSGDYAVVSELLDKLPDVTGMASARIVVYAQNPFNVPNGYGGLGCFQQFYRDRVAAVLCVSEHSRLALSGLLPVSVYRVRYSFDRTPFGPATTKEKLISYMSRRRRDEIQDVLTMLSNSHLLDGWTVETIEWRNEEAVAEWLKKSAVFISGSYREGFGMPPAEAMACGCMVVGWHGFAGREFFQPEFTRIADEADIFSLFSEMQRVLSMDVSEINRMGAKASEYIRSEYSSEKEVDSVLKAWGDITKSSVKLSSKSEVPSVRGVAAFVSTYDEGPYLEVILRWLASRVSRVYVVESKTSFYAAQVPECRRTKEIVERLQAQGVEDICYMELEGQEHPGPDIKEAHERNQAIEQIEKDGFEWVWIVDADEVYTDEESSALWKWFFNAVERNPDVMGARCSWYTYWRSVHWRVEPPERFHPNVIIKSSCRIFSSRHLLPEQEKKIVDVPETTCMVRHYSWARPPSEIKRKTQTWTHAHQMRPDWFEDVFMKWQPGDDLHDFNPTEPSAYKSLVKCDLPVPSVLADHPYVDVEVIEDEVSSRRVDASLVDHPHVDVEVTEDEIPPMRIKAVILNHNQPENSDRLYEQLVDVFDDVEIFDSGSDANKIPIHVGRSFGNIYWTGCWNEIIRTCSDYDAVWMLGDDIDLWNTAQEYRDAIEASLPFGCWSPCVDGRSRPFMQPKHYEDGKRVVVRNIEGMALAVSGRLLSTLERLPEGNDGFGQDLWLCYMSRQQSLRNIIDGSIKVYHPPEVRYNVAEFAQQMNRTFTNLFGSNWRQSAFQYSDNFEENIMSEEKQKPFTIVTVDNGWSYPEFLRITNSFPKARKIIMVKGAGEIPPHEGVEVIRYDESLTRILAEADVALFPKVGAATKPEFEKILAAKIPVVVHVDYHLGLVEHMENGYHYQIEEWARHWLEELQNKHVGGEKGDEDPMLTVEQVEKICSPCAEKMLQQGIKTVRESVVRRKATEPPKNWPPKPKVELKEDPNKKPDSVPPKITIITPTWKRDVSIIKRCIDCVHLQTFEDWEQIICSNGPEEPGVKVLVESLGDPRVKYQFLDGERPGTDFGNSARREMIEKALGEYIVFFDDDNLLLPDYLETMYVKLTNAPNCAFAVCDVLHFGPLNEAQVGQPPKVLKGEPVRLYHIDPLQVMVKADAMKKVGWDTDVGYLSDGVTLENLGNAYEHIKIDRLLAVHM